VLADPVNPVDTKIRRVERSPEQDEAPRVFGWDAAGILEEVGTGVPFFQKCDEVYYSGSLLRPGCNSEFQLVDERMVAANKPLDLNVLKKSVTLSWEFMFTRAMYETGDMIRLHELLEEVAGWISQGHFQYTLTETLSPITAANLHQAHAKLEQGHMIGKLVLAD